MLKPKITNKQMKTANHKQRALQSRLNASFLRGVGSVLWLRDGYSSFRAIPASRDAQALAGDWRRVGNQLWRAIENNRRSDNTHS